MNKIHILVIMFLNISMLGISSADEETKSCTRPSIKLRYDYQSCKLGSAKPKLPVTRALNGALGVLQRLKSLLILKLIR